MKDSFYQARETNFYDNLVIDVKQLYDQFPIDRKIDLGLVEFASSPFHKLYRNPLIPLRHRNRLWRILRQTHIDLSWFEAFRSYWSLVLHGRPLWNVQDFYFLRNLYRIRFQSNQVPDSECPFVHLEAWQRPEIIYSLFHQVLKESDSNQLSLVTQLRKHGSTGLKSFLEFGCATAPITTTLFEFSRSAANLRIFISDIQTLPFHYAAYKFQSCKNVTPIMLTPEEDFLLNVDINVDVIFCITVFEHLNKPLETVKTLHRVLKRNGLLFFDYVKSDARGLDTRQGLEERDKVLDYVESKFDILYGAIISDKSMGLTIAKRR